MEPAGVGEGGGGGVGGGLQEKGQMPRCHGNSAVSCVGGGGVCGFITANGKRSAPLQLVHPLAHTQTHLRSELRGSDPH